LSLVLPRMLEVRVARHVDRCVVIPGSPISRFEYPRVKSDPRGPSSRLPTAAAPCRS
jgi:hypothetical protein